MREIKFRAWDTIHNKMSNNFTLLDCTNDNQVFMMPENFEFMEYSGLKDWEGKELYEGDILGTDRGGELEAYGKIIFDTDLAQYTIQYTNGGWAELWQHLNTKTNQSRELIGNIYENPNLLTREEKR